MQYNKSGRGFAHSAAPKTSRANVLRCRGFTLLEVLGVIAIIGSLAAIAIPQFAIAAQDVSPAAMLANVRYVREQVAYHAAIADVQLSNGGYPQSVDETWFPNHRFPKHAWTNRELRILSRSRPANQIYPSIKTYNSNLNNPITAWYNRTNGSFMILVPVDPDDAKVIEMFNKANGAAITDLGQVN